jgi:hypothetical protein
MAIRAPVAIFLRRKNEGCSSDHEVPDEEQKKKASRSQCTPRRKA